MITINIDPDACTKTELAALLSIVSKSNAMLAKHAKHPSTRERKLKRRVPRHDVHAVL